MKKKTRRAIPRKTAAPKAPRKIRLRITTMEELTAHLLTLYAAVYNKTITLEHARALTNIAGKVISAHKTKLEYNLHMKKHTIIKFLEK